MPCVISVRNLKKTYTSRAGSGEIVHALDGLSLDINEGEISGVLGPNGAGKTTFLNTLSTLLLPDEGKIQILGIDVIPKNFGPIRQLINMSSGYPNYPWVMTIRENLRFYGRLYGLSGKPLEEKVNEVIALFELESFANRRFDELSSGTKQRLSLAKALLNDPKIIFLDEPTVGLDPDVALKTRQIILNVLKKRGVTVLLTSHNMDEVESMCDRVAFIKQGKIIKLSTVGELKSLHHSGDLEQVFIQLAGEDLRDSYRNLNDATVATSVSTGVVRERVVDPKLWFNRCIAFTYRNVIFALRNLFVMTDVFFWPLISLLSVGLMTKFVPMDASMQAFIMTGIIAVGVLQIAQLDVGYTVLYELWSKSLKHTLLAPVGVSEGVLGCWMTGIIRATVVFIFLAVCATWFFGFRLPDALHVMGFLTGLFACGLLLGMLVNVLILSFGAKVEITAWMFAHLFMIICGIYYPIDILPQAFQWLAFCIPITHFLEFFRESYGFTPHTSNPWGVGALLSLLYWFLILRLLESSYTRARKKGVIIRISE